MADVRHDIQSLVIRLYFERRRLLASPSRAAGSGAGGAANETETAAESRDERRRLRLLELEAQLEALSGVGFPPAGGANSVTTGVGP